MQKVSKDITAQNQFTDALRLNGAGALIVDDTGSMNMTVTLQASLDGVTWFDHATTYTAEGWAAIAAGCGLFYRIGVKTGGFTGGTATVYLISAPNV